ncbi:MAG: hypothetical protein RLN69_11410, partial [Woeseiaceae bacterium]
MDALQSFGVVPAVASPREDSATRTAREIQEQVLEDIQAFSSTANPDVLPELEQHLADLVRGVCGLLSPAGSADLSFVQQYARRRAQQRFPLEASLHTYRCAHRVLSGWVRDAALAVADPSAQVRRVVAAATDFVIEYTDVISTAATSEYVLHTRILAEAEGDMRTELL